MVEQTLKLVVLGANGRTGKLVVKAALDRGMDITAVVRSADKKPRNFHNRLHYVVGDPCNAAFLKGILKDQDIVISSLGGRLPTHAATSIYYRSADAIVDATLEMGQKRVLVTSTALLFPPKKLMEKVLRFLVPNVVRSATRMEQILAESDLDWTVARCGFLNDENVSAYRAEAGSLPHNGSSVSRLALAHFLLDAIDRADAHCQAFGVSKLER